MARGPLRGFGRANLRLVMPDADPVGDDIIVDVDPNEDADSPEVNTDGEVLSIEHGDGSVTISMNDKPLYGIGHNRQQEWFDNLADEIGERELGTLTETIMRGIDDDIQSRKEWIDTVATFIKLLGVTIEIPGLQATVDGAPVEGMSKVRHPLLLESVLRFQANARAELLPTDGPMKIRNDSSGGAETNLSADALELDMNHYLTAHATEYYPDTDRMFFRLGLEGTSFKKVYRCPLRMRPVSETVTAVDLIVSNDATDLANARRVTHHIRMSPSTVRRMQIIGAYRDIDLETPVPTDLNAAEREAKHQQGMAEDVQNPEDRDRDLYECYVDLDIPGYEHQWKGKASGLEIPYRVTLDVTSRQVLSLVRNFDKPKDDNELPKARKVFVKYTYVPGLGFYDLGLGHILGNTSNAITAAWREMLDNGMFSNFPGFLIAKSSTRQTTSIVRVPPGGGQPIDTLGKPISQAVMPLPYNTAQMPPLMQLVDSMATTGARIGGTAEIQVGEGKQDAPVGTTLALIEQATKIESSVHKRLHSSQAEEFKLLVDCFREHPEDFLNGELPSGNPWDEQTFLAAISTCDFVPQADPNTASHLHRAMKAMGIKQLQGQSQSLYDPIAVDTYVLKTMGINDPSQFFVPPSAMGQPPPEMLEMQAKMKAQQQTADAKTTEAQARMHTAQAKSAELQAKIQQGGFAKAGQGGPTHLDAMETRAKLEDTQTRRMDAETRRQALVAKAHEAALQSRDREQDRASEANSDRVDLMKAILGHHAAAADTAVGHQHEARENALDRAADVRQAEIQARAAENDKSGDSD
jgi:hypothetical protein